HRTTSSSRDPYTTLFRSGSIRTRRRVVDCRREHMGRNIHEFHQPGTILDREPTESKSNSVARNGLHTQGPLIKGRIEDPFRVTTGNEIQADRIRKYLGHLTHQARSSLLVEIERMQMYDEDISGFEIILAELRAEFRKSGEKHNRIGNPSRYFFKAIEALFVDRSPERANSGQISRGSLSAIWQWINQDMLPSMAR